MRSRLLVVGLVFPMVACGKSSSKSDSVSGAITAPFLTAADLTPGNAIASPAQSSVTDALQGQSGVYDNRPKKSPDTSACTAITDALVVHAAAATGSVGATVDLTQCVTQDATASATAGVKEVFTAVSGKIYVAFTCVGGDLSSLNGKTLGALGKTNPLTGCTSGTVVSNSEFIVAGSATFTNAGQTQTVSLNSRSVTYEGKADLTPCAVTIAGSDETYDNSCVSIDHTLGTSNNNGKDTPTEDFTKLTYNNIHGDIGQTAVWYSSGTISVIHDNWTGTLTYTAPATAPTYTLTPQGGAAVTGSLVPTPSLTDPVGAGLVTAARREPAAPYAAAALSAQVRDRLGL